MGEDAVENDAVEPLDVTGRASTGVRSIVILEVLARAGTPLTATEINDTLGLPKATIHRLCQRLEQERLIERDMDGKRYMPARRLAALARGTMQFAVFRQTRHAVLDRLSKAVGETCNITVPEKDGMLYLDRVETRWPLRMQIPIEGRVPFHATASGKLYLSSLRRTQRERLIRNLSLEPLAPNTIVDVEALMEATDQIARQKYGTDDQEFVAGMTAIAVPVLDEDGRFAATLAIHGPMQRMNLEQALEHLDRLREAASDLREVMIG
ncbi:MAG: IclR family transcriptional regulator [Pseudomonadota bacterium]